MVQIRIGGDVVKELRGLPRRTGIFQHLLLADVLTGGLHRRVILEGKFDGLLLGEGDLSKYCEDHIYKNKNCKYFFHEMIVTFDWMGH